MKHTARKDAGRTTEKQGAGMIPVRTPAPVAAGLAERFGDLVAEPFGPMRWPFRWPELSWPRELARMPEVDVYEEGEDIVVKADLPGLAREDVEVSIQGDVLTLSGKKDKEEKVERKDYYRYERSSGTFHRSILLPAEVQVDRISARLEEGVLEVRAPKTPAALARSRKIEVT